MPDVISRLNAALTGRYRIERELGEGGMATVYLAADIKHERKVALKVLKPDLAAVVGAERFLAEIRTTANLQHPHILPLFDSGSADGFLFYVMPHVEGESLRESLDREHQLPVADAVRIATNVAEALDYAHRRGVIHRDIKPANILLQDGKPVISDFGIALAVTAGGANRLTETGLPLGTPHYMSPEQATGDVSVGSATDIYSLGCVLYEMLVGEPPYLGSTPQAILGKIIAGEAPSVTKQRPSVPPNLDAAIRSALEKLPADRFASGGDFAKALADAAFRHRDAAPAGVGGRFAWHALALAVVGAALGAGAAAVWFGAQPVAPARVTRFSIVPPSSGSLDASAPGQGLAISPDGSAIAYVGRGQGGTARQIYVRRMDQMEAMPVSGTEGGYNPFFSPDGTRLGFIDSQNDRLLRWVATSGGTAVTIATLPDDIPQILGAAWGEDDVIVMGSASVLFRVAADGGAPVPLTSLEDTWDRQEFPSIIEGRGAILFQLYNNSIRYPASLAVLDLDTREVKSLGLEGSSPRYLETGHLVYADGSLRAVPFDLESLEVRGSPVTLVEGVGIQPNGAARFTVSANGHLVYQRGAGSTGTAMNLVLVTRDGRRSVLAEFPGFLEVPRYSPDGARVAYTLWSDPFGGEADLWVLDVARGAQTRVTFGGYNYPSVWTPDGTRLTHVDNNSATNRLLTTAADGGGTVDTLLPLGDRRFPTSWSPDGRTLVYYVGPDGTPTNSRDLWTLEVSGGSREATPWVVTPFEDRGGVFSPDGGWVAFVSDKSGRNEIYARPFPGLGGEVTISTGGGTEPAWARSGEEIYYRSDGDLVSVAIERVDARLIPGPPRRVFADAYVRANSSGGAVSNYDVSPSGIGFLMLEEAAPVDAPAEPAELQVVLNWFAELRARVPN